MQVACFFIARLLTYIFISSTTTHCVDYKIKIVCDSNPSGQPDEFISGKKAFIFSLKNLKGLPPFKMELHTNASDKAAKQKKDRGPVFGDDDIYIDDFAGDYVKSKTEVPRSFQFPPGLNLSENDERVILAGSKSFDVDEMEVFYYVGECLRIFLVLRDKFSLYYTSYFPLLFMKHCLNQAANRPLWLLRFVLPIQVT